MQLKALTYLIQHPDTVNLRQTEELSALIKKFPYAQPLRALQLKGLKQQNSYTYNKALKITAAHTTDRSVLFDYITSAIFNQNTISKYIQQNAETLQEIKLNTSNDTSTHNNVSFDDDLKAQIKATEGVLDPNLFTAKDSVNSGKSPKIEDRNIKMNAKQTPPDVALKIGTPLDFDTSDSYSFAEWLKLTSFKPLDRAIDSETRDDFNNSVTPHPLDAKLSVIDKFINDKPKIAPVIDKSSKEKLINNDNDTPSDSLMTETLARIYLEQSNYDKAIQSYKILSLKYPEKSSFFADQIILVQKLKDNKTV